MEENKLQKMREFGITLSEEEINKVIFTLLRDFKDLEEISNELSIDMKQVELLLKFLNKDGALETKKIPKKSEEQKNIKKVSEAIIFAEEKHKGQLCDEGLDYFQAHIVPVTQAVEMFTTKADVVMSAVLHDVIEDTDCTEEELRKKFGDKVADLVMEVTHEGEKDNYGYYFPRLKSPEAFIIKMCDRASNISRMGGWTEERKAHYLKKTFQIWKDGSDRK